MKFKAEMKNFYNITEETNNEGMRDHNWWPRVGRAYMADPRTHVYGSLK